jgi:nucleoside-diphosphate-sugar epimerase
MNILITGAGGFAGKILRKKLAEKYPNTYGLDLSLEGKNSFSADITDYKSVVSCLKQIKPDFIFHLAAISRVDLKDKRRIYEVNTLGTLNIANACLELESLPKILFTSSAQVYGNTLKNNIDENTKVNPVNHYGASKAACENILMGFISDVGLPVVISRSFNHTGRGQAPNFIISKFIEAFKKKTQVLDVGNLDVIRDFLDVRDTVNAYISIMNNFHSGEIYNVCSGNGIQLKKIPKELEKLTNHKIQFTVNPDFLRDNEIMEITGSNSKIRKQCFWEPVYSIEDTLKWMLDK